MSTRTRPRTRAFARAHLQDTSSRACVCVCVCVCACMHARHLIARLRSGHVSRRCLCVIVVLERDDVGVIELLHDAQLSIAVSRILQHAFDRHLCTETMCNAR